MNNYLGISGVKCEVEDFDFGQGVVLSKAYAHLMAHFMAAFAQPAGPGKPHPAPWAAASSGGLSFDMTLQLTVPSESDKPFSTGTVTIGWWIIALLRLRVGPRLRAPAISSLPLCSDSAASSDLQIHPLEVVPYQLNIAPESHATLSLADLEWARSHWDSRFLLREESPAFRLLFEATDQAAFNRSPELALLTLWAGLEDVFSPSKTELRYRISSLIAAFLNPPGRVRLEHQKSIAKLYDARSSAAHGRASDLREPLWDTYDLARRTVIKIITDNHVPTKEELEERMFGADGA